MIWSGQPQPLTMIHYFSYLLPLQGGLPTCLSSVIYAFIVLVLILLFFRALNARHVIAKNVEWKYCPSRKDGETSRRHSIVKRMNEKKEKLQRRAKSFSHRIRESSFPSNESDGFMKSFELPPDVPSVVEGPSSVLSRLEKMICRSLSNEGRLLVHSLRTLDIFGAAHMGVLKGICENAQPMESFKKGETICLALDEILDLIVLVSGSAATYMQVEDHLGNTVKRRVVVRDRPSSLLTSITDILSMVVYSVNGLNRRRQEYLRITSETPCSIVRVKASKIIDFLRENIDLATRAHIMRMILIRIGQLSFMTTYRYLGLIHSVREPLEPIPPKNGTIHVGECRKDQDIIRLVYQSLGLPNSETEGIMNLLSPVVHVEGPKHEDDTQNQKDEQSPQRRRVVRNLDKEVGMHVIQLESGETLMGERDQRPCFYVVLSGFLKISITEEETVLFAPKLGDGAATFSSDNVPISHGYSYGPGSVIGLAAMLMGATSTVYSSHDSSSTPMLSIQADGPASVARMSARTHDALVSKYPVIVEYVAHSFLHRIPLVIQLIDRVSTFVELEATEVLIQKDEPSHSLYYVLHGKLVATSPNDATPLDSSMQKGQSNDEVLWVYRRGAVIGESEILAQGPNLTKVTAVRPSKLQQLTGSTLALLYSLYPSIVANIARTSVLKRSSHRQGNAGLHHMGHVRSFFIVPASPGASSESGTLYQFARELGVALSRIDRTPGMICPRVVASHMGVDLDDKSKRGSSISDTILQAFSSWIPAVEEKNDLALYCAEDKDFPWAKDYNLLCKQQADVVILLVDAADTPQLSDLEYELGVGPSECRQYSDNILIVVHKDPPEGYSPKNTSKWFEGRSVHHHYHIRLLESQPFGSSPDFLRVARCLTGQGLGLVLGGGGARGFSHLGLLRILEEEKIPVDLIVGTSIGAFLGGLYAFNNLISRIVPIAQGFSKRMRFTWAMMKDLTLPITSYFSGAYMNMYMMETFKSRQIEDSWITYSCITTNVMQSDICVHQKGTAWRYIRASMSLVGLLPPLCEKFQDSNGQMKVAYLVDGGYLSVLPVDTVRSLGAWAVIACDVSGTSKISDNMADFGDSLSGTSSFFSKFFSNVRSRIPSMGLLNSELCFLTARREHHSTVYQVPRDLYLQPPLGDVGTLQFESYSTIMMLGYEFAQKRVREWKEQNQKIGELYAICPEKITIEDQESMLYGFSEIPY